MKIRIIQLLLILLIIIPIAKPTYAKYVIKTEVAVAISSSVDNQGPVVQIIDINSKEIANNGTAIEKIIISYSDSLSGIQSATYKYNASEKNFEGLDSSSLTNNATFTNKGWYEITVIDNVGNRNVREVYIAEAVSKINQIYYEKLEDAIEDVPTNNEKTTIMMIKNTSEVNIIPNKKNILLDINNKTITGSFTIDLGGNLEIKNGTVKNNAQIPMFTNNGSLTIVDGTYTSTKDGVINSSGTLNINGGNISSGSANVITLKQTAGITNITGGTISCTYQETEARAVHVASDSAIFNMSGGTISGYTSNMCTFEGQSVVNLTGGIIKNMSTTNEFASAMCVYWGCEVTIDGATIQKAVSGRTIYIDRGTVYFKKGTISSVSFRGSNCECIEISDDSRTRTTIVANFVMSGGTASAKGASPVIRVREGGKFIISGGTVKNNGSGYAVLRDGGQTVISGGNLIGGIH